MLGCRWFFLSVVLIGVVCTTMYGLGLGVHGAEFLSFSLDFEVCLISLIHKIPLGEEGVPGVFLFLFFFTFFYLL